jgi:hypothetical protein
MYTKVDIFLIFSLFSYHINNVLALLFLYPGQIAQAHQLGEEDYL